MNTVLRLLFILVLLLITAHRLPAPISEIPQTTPTPKPKREATPHQKPKTESTAKPQKSPTRSFAGNWAGPATLISSNGNRGNANYIIRISDDEKTVSMNWNLVGKKISETRIQALCNRSHEALIWSIASPKRMITDTLQLNANGTASFVSKGMWTSGRYAGVTYTHTGVFSRQR